MAEFFVRNSLNLNKAVRFNVALIKTTPKGELGEPHYVLEIGTTHSGIDPNIRNAAYIHRLDNVEDLDEAIGTAIASICSNIDWSDLDEDLYPPELTEQYPTGPDTSIESTVSVTLEDYIPAAGIDLSEMKVYLDTGDTTFNITSEVTVFGDPFKYKLKWNPPLRVYSTYTGE